MPVRRRWFDKQQAAGGGPQLVQLDAMVIIWSTISGREDQISIRTTGLSLHWASYWQCVGVKERFKSKETQAATIVVDSIVRECWPKITRARVTFQIAVMSVPGDPPIDIWEEHEHAGYVSDYYEVQESNLRVYVRGGV
ncbi:hypothetical protein MKZ38_002305 [Zalerion maritima]|uniref:Uncharacterized protein n=1 Tax=Zalerion maritima TaxID=339359 RepID=A0AAD5RVV7_9PEZI|nr:hypothetical protein MKZ38_002305 [Zalerion maritima]